MWDRAPIHTVLFAIDVLTHVTFPNTFAGICAFCLPPYRWALTAEHIGKSFALSLIVYGRCAHRQLSFGSPSVLTPAVLNVGLFWLLSTSTGPLAPLAEVPLVSTATVAYLVLLILGLLQTLASIA